MESSSSKPLDMAVQDIIRDVREGTIMPRTLNIKYYTLTPKERLLECRFCSKLSTIGIVFLDRLLDDKNELKKMKSNVPNSEKLNAGLIINQCRMCSDCFSGYISELKNRTSKVIHKKICWNCHWSSENFKVCGRCRSAVYCSRECQLSAWPEHKKTCKE
jgi:hypothetical protein